MFSYPLYRDISQGNHVFSGILASGEVSRITLGREEGRDSVSDQVLGALVSGNYFSVLGVNAFLGRTFIAEEDDVEHPHPVAVISYGFWVEHFGRNSAILGSTVRFNNFPFTIIGIAFPGFYGDTVGDRQDVWFPLSMQPQVLSGRLWLKNYEASWLHLIGRLKPGFGLSQAKADLNLLLQQLVRGPLKDKFEGLDQATLDQLQLEVSDGRLGFSSLRNKFERPLLLLMIIVALVLIVACINVGSLLMVRSLARQREFAIRLSLGAPKWRIVRQFLTESMVLSFLGGLVGLLIAYFGTNLLLKMSQASALEVPVDLYVLLFTTAISIFAGILFGLAPAFYSVRVPINSALKTGAEGRLRTDHGVHRWNWGKVLVIAQVGLSLAVAFDAALFVRTIQNLKNVNLGYVQEKLLLVRVDPLSAGYKTLEQRVNLADQLTTRISSLPGVRAVTFSRNGIFSGLDGADNIRIDGFIPRQNEDLNVASERVGPDYFSVLGIPFKEGREIGSQDRAEGPWVAVINQAMAEHYFPHLDPIGRRIWLNDPDRKDVSWQIVGIAGDAQDHGIRDRALPRFYVPLGQSQDPAGDLNFMIRTNTSPEALAATVRKTIKGLDSALPIVSARTLDERINESISSELLVAKLTSFFGGLALALACMGLYGVMSYTVTRRTKAIGLRMALGAKRLDVLWLVMKEAMVLVLIGMGAGIPVALLCSRLFMSMLFQLQSTDPAAMSVAIVLLTVVAIFASYLPARRAMQVDPLLALRQE